MMLWSARDVAHIGRDLQETLVAYSRERLGEQQRQASFEATLWVTIFLLGLAAVAAGTRIVLNSIVAPLGRLRRSMLALAEGDLSTPLPEHARKDEIGAMADALRVFKANAIRRERLQEEREGLLRRLRQAHDQLRQDLEAASVVQASLLPRPTRLGSITFSGELRPSHFISGDTYDLLHQPNGPVHFFLADVAGHGAAAALVSVASRYAVIEALLRHQDSDSLAKTMAHLNNDWPEHLPYFTMIMGELRAEEGRGAIVQAGHPPPLLVRKSGAVEMIGQGGLPVGVIREAEYDEIRFSFEPGDRLFVYSDGLSEAESPSGQPFTEERLVKLVQAHSTAATEKLLALVMEAVQDWRASDTAEDDMTLLVLEANEKGSPSDMRQRLDLSRDGATLGGR